MEKSKFLIGKSFRELLQSINAEPAGIAFVEDQEERLIGVFTDGDLRRALLSGIELNNEFQKKHLNESFVFSFEGEDINALIKKTSKKVGIIPILDKNHRLVDYFRYEHKTHYTPVAEPSLKGKELEYVTDAVLSTWISSSGKYIEKFEETFPAYCDVKHGVATSNGTVAIHLALEALGIGKGDEVIVPDLTFAATINAVLYTGATPVIVDVDLNRWTLCPQSFQEAITSNTKAVIPVHIYGQPCEMDKIMAIAKERNIKVVEDCAEAHGANFKGQKVGSFGDISTFSFFANKIITTGEGGMCITNDEKLDQRMRVLRDHGMNKNKRYWHDVVGFNYRMTNLQAAIGCAQLERINEIQQNRIDLEKKYKKQLSSFFTWQESFEYSDKVVWLICAKPKFDKEKLIRKAKESNIDIRTFFYPLSEMEIYKRYVYNQPVNSKLISNKWINLPTVENIDFKDLEAICDEVS